MRSKEIAFTLPLVLVVAEVALLDGPPRSRALALAPFLATLALIPAALVVSSGSLSAASGQDPFVQALGKAPLSRVEYLLTQLRVIPTYLRLLVLPVDQTFDYDFPVEHGVSPAVLASAALLAAVLAAGIVLLVRGRRDAPRARVAGYGIVWFLVALSVESSVVPIDDVINEHRVYLPSVGFALAVAAGLAALAEWLRPRWRPATGVIAAGAAAWILGLAVAAHLRNEVWGDPVGFWRDAVEKAPRKPRTWVNLGVALGDAGRLDEAIHAYESALRIDPGQVLARYNLANVYVRMGLVEPAVRHLEALLRRTPGSPATRTTLASLYVRQGRQDRAEEELLAALRADPSCGPALEALARLRRERAARP
jgi:tetratricopeptide (TPR) repeat protein